MADSIIGITGKDFVLIAGDSAQTRSIMVIKESGEDKILKLDSHKLLAASGENGDRVAFTQYIQKNLALQYYRNDAQSLSTAAAAHFTRRALADALRSNPYSSNLLLGGWDEEAGASLYYIDYLASMQKLPFGCQGYAGHFLMGLLDNGWKEDLSLEEARALLDKCIAQLKQRFVLNQGEFIVKVVDKDGVRVLNDA
mmetsp:Transcript_16081/g.27509  ORF Transcript_16081/g.27509 Transcript_16081/m.27509 type:complete len:197 (+) Transcript_16081:87-677(+)